MSKDHAKSQSHGPSIGEQSFARQSTQQHDAPAAQSIATAHEAGLREMLPPSDVGESPLHASKEMPMLGAGSGGIPVGVGEGGHGALADHQAIDVGNLGVKLPEDTPLKDVKYVGETDLGKGVSPGSNLNAINDHGLGAIDAVSSGPTQGGH